MFCFFSEKFPLTSDQIFEKEVERKLLSEWGKSRRLDYKKYQNQVCLKSTLVTIDCDPPFQGPLSLRVVFHVNQALWLDHECQNSSKDQLELWIFGHAISS